MDTVEAAEQSPEKILDLQALDVNFEKEMPHLMLCGTNTGTRKNPMKNGGRRSYSATKEVCTASLKENSTTDPLARRRHGVNLTNKQFSIILQSMGHAVHIVDHNGLIVYWNREAESLFGYSESEALGRSPLELIIEECDHNKATEIICRSSIGQIWTGRFPVMNKNGRRFLGFGTTTPLYDDCGVFVGVICLSLDSQPFYEHQTLFSAGTYLSLEATYPSSSEPSKDGPTTTGLNSQEKHVQATVPSSKVSNLTSRIITKVSKKMRPCKKTMAQNTQVGDGPYFDHHGSLQTACPDDREDPPEEISPELLGNSAEEGECKFGICKTIVSSVTRMLLPWKRREQDGFITRSNIPSIPST